MRGLETSPIQRDALLDHVFKDREDSSSFDPLVDLLFSQVKQVATLPYEWVLCLAELFDLFLAQTVQQLAWSFEDQEHLVSAEDQLPNSGCAASFLRV